MIIYKTINLINGKIYIGQDSKNNPDYLGSGNILKYAIKKYGIKNFTKEILEYCDSKEHLNEREIFWIEKMNSRDLNIGYNIAIGGTGGKLIDVECKKGKTYEEYYGIERAAEIKEKQLRSRIGKPLVLKNITRDELNLKISKANEGKTHTDENRMKISESVKIFYETENGKKLKDKLSKSRLGTHLSDETKRKQSDKMKGVRPKILDVHPSARYWFFYNKENELVLKTLGDRTNKLKELKTNQKRIVIFDNEEDCLNHELSDKHDFKVFWIKYYNKS